MSLGRRGFSLSITLRSSPGFLSAAETHFVERAVELHCGAWTWNERGCDVGWRRSEGCLARTVIGGALGGCMKRFPLVSEVRLEEFTPPAVYKPQPYTPPSRIPPQPYSPVRLT